MNKSHRDDLNTRDVASASQLDWAQILGLEVVSSRPQEVVLQWNVDSRHLQPWGVVHGGVHASVVETACSMGAQNSVPAGHHVVGVENHTSFVRAMGKGRLRATAKPLHAGRRAQLWECQIVDERERLIATGRLRLLCVENAPAAGVATDEGAGCSDRERADFGRGEPATGVDS